MDQPFLPDQDIELAAQSVISAFEKKYNLKITAPVPVEDIIDCVLGITVEAADLRSKYKSSDVLAEYCVYCDRQVIRVDNSISPEYHLDQLGRYHFTLGHEIGHRILHQNELPRYFQFPLFDDDPSILSLYRSSQRDRKEIQADKFASYLLMPQYLVRQAWEEKFGPELPTINVYEEIRHKAELFEEDRQNIRCDLAREFAEPFEVSIMAMQIRLSELNLLELTKPTAIPA